MRKLKALVRWTKIFAKKELLPIIYFALGIGVAFGGLLYIGLLREGYL